MNRILVIHRGSLGDFLLLLPSLAALRRKFPEARIEALGRIEILSLLCPGILDSTASVDRAALVPFFEDSAGLPEDEAGYFSSFDAVLAYLSDPRKILESNLTRLRIRNFVVRPPFPPAGTRIHVGRYLFETVVSLLERHPASERVADSPCLLFFEEDEIRHAEAFLGPTRSEGRPIVAIHPGSGGEKKCWPPERFEALARRLAKESGCGILLILGPADERLVERMRTLREEIVCAIAHNLPLRQLAAVLSKCSAHVGNDSGVTHLAAATGIPTLALFGPTDPGVWAPLGRNVRVMSGDTECSPCAREAMRECGEQVCLEEISLEDVVRATRKMPRSFKNLSKQ